MIKNLYISGYRSYEMNVFNQQDDRLLIIKKAIKEKLIEKVEEGLEWVIISGQLGIELWGAEVVLEMKEEGIPIKLGVLLPFKNYGEKWNEQNSQLLEKVTTKADFFEYSSQQNYFSPKQLQANQEFILKHTDSCLMVYDLEYEGKPQFLYNHIKNIQENHPYGLQLISFEELEETARTEAENQYFEQNDF